MAVSPAVPLLITLQLSRSSFEHFDSLRRLYFPPHLNQVPAHISLFHHLPGEEVAVIQSKIRAHTSALAPFRLHVSGLRFLGRGVAYVLQSEQAFVLHRCLAHAFEAWLTPQDRQRFSPHITIQNKVDPTRAQALFQELQSSFIPFKVTAEGVLLWHYRNGPWDLAAIFPFQRQASRITETDAL